MATFICIFILLAVLHFVYEGIIAPSLRLELRFSLFEIRDDLRALKIAHGANFQTKHFEYLQNSINSLIANLYRVDVASASAALYKLERDQEFRNSVEQRSKILDDCSIEEARVIRKRSISLVTKAIAVNNASLIVYLLPIFAGAYFIGKIGRSVKAIASMSEKEFDSVSPTMRLSPMESGWPA